MSNCQDLEPLFTPYVDGEATAEQRAAIEAHFATCPTCRECADAEKQVREALQSCRHDLITQAPARLHQKCAALAERTRVTTPSDASDAAAAATSTAITNAAARTGRATGPSTLAARPLWQRWAPLSLVATVVLVVAGVFGYSLLSNRGTALAADLVKDHMRCIGIVGDRAPSDPAVSRTTWQRRLGWEVDVPLFESHDDLQFVQLRRCLHGQGVDMAHILYRRQGRLLSLFVMPEHEPDQRELMVKGQRTVIWSQGGRTYAVVGASSSAEVQELADRFSRALP